MRHIEWRDLALLAGILVLALLATWRVWQDIAVEAMRDQEQSHIFMAIPVVLWLGYLRRARLHTFRAQQSMIGPLVMLLGGVVSGVGFKYGFDLFWHIGAIAIVAGSFIAVLGTRFARVFLPSFVAMLFVLPVPGRLRAPIAGLLQNVSAGVAEFGLDLFAVPVILDGNALNVNGVDVVIAEACNGMRMVSALALIVFAFMFSIPMRNSIRILLILLCPFVALFVNVVRLIPTSLMYGYADQDTASLFHDVSGWAVLALAIAILWSFIAMLRWIEVPIAPFAIVEDQS